MTKKQNLAGEVVGEFLIIFSAFFLGGVFSGIKGNPFVLIVLTIFLLGLGVVAKKI